MWPCASSGGRSTIGLRLGTQLLEDPDKGWLDRWADAQEVVERWEERTGRLLPIEQATELTRQISQALQRAYERGKAQAKLD